MNGRNIFMIYDTIYGNNMTPDFIGKTFQRTGPQTGDQLPKSYTSMIKVHPYATTVKTSEDKELNSTTIYHIVRSPQHIRRYS